MLRDSAERETRFAGFCRLLGHAIVTVRVAYSTWTPCNSTAEPDRTAMHNTRWTFYDRGQSFLSRFVTGRFAGILGQNCNWTKRTVDSPSVLPLWGHTPLRFETMGQETNACFFLTLDKRTVAYPLPCRQDTLFTLF